MKKKKYFILGGLLVGTLLTACSDTKIPEEVGEIEVSNTVEQEENESTQVAINSASREAVIRSLGYDAEKGETGSVFCVYISDELKEKEEVLEQITSSEYCKDWKEVYSIVADVQLQKEQLREEWMEWNNKEEDNLTISQQLKSYGFVNPFKMVYSSPDQTETIITASQIKEENVQGYTGKLAVTCEVEDKIMVRYIPNEVDMEKWETIEAKEVTINQVTMDTPWWINREAYSSDPVLILSWEKYKELSGDTNNSYYVFRDSGENQELRTLAEELTKEYGSGNKMILFMDSYFEPLE